MLTLYYTFTILFLLNELRWIVTPVSMAKRAELYINSVNKSKNLDLNVETLDRKSMLGISLLSTFIVLWMFLGLLTNQWPIYLLILSFNICIVNPISKLLKYNKGYIILHWTNSIIGFIFGLFVMINYFHLKIDITELAIQLFSK